MRLVASSYPGDVDRDAAIHWLTTRAVLTRNVCRELLESEGVFYSRRVDIAYGILIEWVEQYFPESFAGEAEANSGLDVMVAPDDCQELVKEIRDGAWVCACLFRLNTADHLWEAEQDSAGLKLVLEDYWKEHPAVVNPPATRLASER